MACRGRSPGRSRCVREAVRVSCVTSRAARVRTRPLCHAAIASLNIDTSSFCDAMPTVAPHRRSSGPKFGPTNFQTLQIVRKSALSEGACLVRHPQHERSYVAHLTGAREVAPFIQANASLLEPPPARLNCQTDLSPAAAVNV